MGARLETVGPPPRVSVSRAQGACSLSLPRHAFPSVPLGVSSGQGPCPQATAQVPRYRRVGAASPEPPPCSPWGVVAEPVPEPELGTHRSHCPAPILFWWGPLGGPQPWQGPPPLARSSQGPALSSWGPDRSRPRRWSGLLPPVPVPWAWLRGRPPTPRAGRLRQACGQQLSCLCFAAAAARWCPLCEDPAPRRCSRALPPPAPSVSIRLLCSLVSSRAMCSPPARSRLWVGDPRLCDPPGSMVLPPRLPPPRVYMPPHPCVPPVGPAAGQCGPGILAAAPRLPYS